MIMIAALFVETGACQRLSHRQRAATPLRFRDLLLDLARQCSPVTVASAEAA